MQSQSQTTSSESQTSFSSTSLSEMDSEELSLYSDFDVSDSFYSPNSHNYAFIDDVFLPEGLPYINDDEEYPFSPSDLLTSHWENQLLGEESNSSMLDGEMDLEDSTFSLQPQDDLEIIDLSQMPNTRGTNSLPRNNQTIEISSSSDNETSSLSANRSRLWQPNSSANNRNNRNINNNSITNNNSSSRNNSNRENNSPTVHDLRTQPSLSTTVSGINSVLRNRAEIGRNLRTHNTRSNIRIRNASRDIAGRRRNWNNPIELVSPVTQRSRSRTGSVPGTLRNIFELPRSLNSILSVLIRHTDHAHMFDDEPIIFGFNSQLGSSFPHLKIKANGGTIFESSSQSSEIHSINFSTPPLDFEDIPISSNASFSFIRVSDTVSFLDCESSSAKVIQRSDDMITLFLVPNNVTVIYSNTIAQPNYRFLNIESHTRFSMEFREFQGEPLRSLSAYRFLLVESSEEFEYRKKIRDLPIKDRIPSEKEKYVVSLGTHSRDVPLYNSEDYYNDLGTNSLLPAEIDSSSNGQLVMVCNKCYSEFMSTSTIMVPNCGHPMCSECHRLIKTATTTCPSCKTKVKTKAFIKVFHS
ncbi:hypothetical protein BB560_002708 [Smittium megazygosporum]|uniref:RING-type domain-containing protein n=1 Tax=Smittium megazygosporum TaxID=133381 RepID=A0A2T9ZE51_9FUNG|nr:hypothetical protein BB560_002708 [Smittium megazygosporum]